MTKRPSISHADLLDLAQRWRAVRSWTGSARLLTGIAVSRAGVDASYVGESGGEHYYRTASGQFFSFDCVVDRCTLHVGEIPKNLNR
tara:strand:+ start:2796 stop:3056 length:261 start_codon:yes stop_codon:yes gene_type:complete